MTDRDEIATLTPANEELKRIHAILYYKGTDDHEDLASYARGVAKLRASSASQATEISTLRIENDKRLEIISSVAYDVDKFGSIDGPTWVKIRAALSSKETP